MLAKVPAPAAVNHHHHLLRPKRLEPESWMAGTHSCKCLYLHQTRKWGISCSFSQRPTDNPAAAAEASYDLMDDFIVLGQDNNAPPTPTTRNTTTHPGNDRQPAPTPRRVAQSFGRLKVHRVKSIAEKPSRIKQEIDESDDEVNVQDAQPFGNPRSRLGFDGKKNKADARGLGGRRSSDSHSKEFRDMRRRKGTANNMDHSPVKRTENGFEPISDNQNKHHKPYRSDANIAGQKDSAPRGSSAHSKGWGNGGGSMYDLAELPDLNQRRKFSTDNDFFSRKSFRDVGCSEYMIECLKRQLFQRPSHIQVLGVCRSMSKFGVPVRSMVVTGGHRQKTQMESLEQGVDILIATPGRFMYLIKEGFVHLSNLRCAVLDEVDILFNDEDFEAALESLINSAPVTMQYLFVTATLPLGIYNKLVESFPDCKVVMAPGMHRISSGLEEVLVDCSGDDGSERSPKKAFSNKKSALLQLVEGTFPF